MKAKKKIIGIEIGGTKIHLGEVQDGKIINEIKFSTSAGAPRHHFFYKAGKVCWPLVIETND